MDVNERNLVQATKPYAKDDPATSWRHLLTTIFVLSVLYAGTLIPSHWAIQLVFSVITGFTLVRMFIIYHDYLHKTILRRSPLANIIFSIFGLYILAPKSIWRRSHDYHHKHNSKLYTTSIGSFPIVTKKKFLAMSPGQRKMYLFIRHPLTIGFGYIFAFLFGMCIQPLLRSPQKHLDCALSILFHFTIGYLMWHFFGLTSFLCGFVAVSFLTGAMGSYLFYAQHNFPAARFEDKEGWTYVKAALQSSSYMAMSPLLHWFNGNIGYHHIHHINARIPFYRLPEVFEAFDVFQQVRPTSLSPREIWRCLQLKVWDPEAGRMVGLKEMRA